MLRFTPTEIAFHWAIALPYLVLLGTGALPASLFVGLFAGGLAALLLMDRLRT